MVDGFLTGLRVLECGDFISAPFCARMLADMGAEVIKVEPPSGDSARRFGPFPHDTPHPERSGLFLSVNLNKKGITLNLAEPGARRLLLQLAQESDVLVENVGLSLLGLDAARLWEANPSLVITSISPFGPSGPFQSYKGSELVLNQMTVLGNMTPSQIENPAEENPIKAAGHQAYFSAGLNAAVATMHGIFARDVSGKGQLIDMSEHEAVSAMSSGGITRYSQDGTVSIRLRGLGSGGVVLLLPASNGYFCFVPMEEAQWQRWMDVLGNPEWATREEFKDRNSRTQHWDELEPLVVERTMQYTKEDLARKSQASRVPLLQVNSPKELAESPQISARGFFVEVDHPVAGTLKYPKHPYQLESFEYQPDPAPLLGQHNEEILCGRLGINKSDQVTLFQGGVI